MPIYDVSNNTNRHFMENSGVCHIIKYSTLFLFESSNTGNNKMLITNVLEILTATAVNRFTLTIHCGPMVVGKK